MSFLDITIIKHNDNSIHTVVFYKTTNAHRYLHFTSQHHGFIKRNIPFNLAKRPVRILSNPDTLSYRLEELKEFLLKRKYPDKLIDNGSLRAQQEGPRIRTRLDEEMSILPFVITHNVSQSIDFELIKKLIKNVESNHLKKHSTLNSLLHVNNLVDLRAF